MRWLAVLLLVAGSAVVLPPGASAERRPLPGVTQFDGDADGRLDAQVAAYRELFGASEAAADLKYDQQFLVAELLKRLQWHDGVMHARVNEQPALTQVEVTVEPKLCLAFGSSSRSR